MGGRRGPLRDLRPRGGGRLRSLSGDEGLTEGLSEARPTEHHSLWRNRATELRDTVPDIPRERWNATPNRVLLGELLAKHTTPHLTAYYWEAIRALREGDEAICYSIAGHALRELQNGLPNYLNVPVAGGLGEFFGWLRDTWRPIVVRQTAREAGELWIGTTIEPRLGRFLATLDEKVEIYAAAHPLRREVHQSALAHLDPGLGQTPQSVQKVAVETWMRLQDTFNSATHSSNPEEFEAAVEEFEAFLSDRLAPKTFEKRDAIAALVLEGELNADA